MICMKNVIFERGTTNVQYFMQNKSETGREVLHCIAILGGTLFYAAGMNLFVVPAGLYTGGIMGLAQLLRTLLIHLTGWTPKIDIAGLLNYAINLPVLLIAWRRLDRTVVLKTLLAVTGITIFLTIIPRTDILSGDQLARCLIGGILCGGSIGIIEDGELCWPLPGHTYISCNFGEEDAYGNSGHRGTDIPAPEGTPILAAHGGTVIISGWNNSYGNQVLLDNGAGLSTRYAHMTAAAVSAGETVTAGQVIGYVGNTGDSTGFHLHFEVMQNGVRVNPLDAVTPQ